jgi:hypothetical protein
MMPKAPMILRFFATNFLLSSILLCSSASAQTATLNLSHDLVTDGIASANMTPGQPALDSRPLLEAAVSYAGRIESDNRFSEFKPAVHVEQRGRDSVHELQ